MKWEKPLVWPYGALEAFELGFDLSVVGSATRDFFGEHDSTDIGNVFTESLVEGCEKSHAFVTPFSWPAEHGVIHLSIYQALCIVW